MTLEHENQFLNFLRAEMYPKSGFTVFEIGKLEFFGLQNDQNLAHVKCKISTLWHSNPNLKRPFSNFYPDSF